MKPLVQAFSIGLFTATVIIGIVFFKLKIQVVRQHLIKMN